MASIGMAGLGENTMEDNGCIWIGDDGPNAFEFVHNAPQGPITLGAWEVFPDSLNGPMKVEGFEIEFKDLSIVLNVYNFIHIQIRSDVIIADPDQLIWSYYKSGTVPTVASCVSTYGNSLPHDDAIFSSNPIVQFKNNLGYKLEFPVAGRNAVCC